MLRSFVRLAPLCTFAVMLLPAQQTVWFTPLPSAQHPVGFFGSVDYMKLFSPTAPWKRAASHVQVFKLYGLDNFSDADLTRLFADLKRRNIALALEWPVLNSNTCGSGIEGFGGNIAPVVKRIKSLQGELKYIAMQQPFQWGSLYTGANACKWSARRVATNALVQIKQAKAVFPNVLVGDIMAVPPFREGSDWAAQYGVWFDTWRSLAGAPLAFFHVDADWTVPNWQAAVAAVRPVADRRRIPFGMVYNGFLTDETDAAWIAATENHFLDYEVRSGATPPAQVNFQTWNPHPTHVLPETDPTAFTYLINRYFRRRTQLTLKSDGGQISGKLIAGHAAVPGAQVRITRRPISGSGAVATYTITGHVPASAHTAIVGVRVNSECYNCNGPVDVTLYNFQYSESSPVKTWDFANGINGWGYGPGSPVFDSGPAPFARGLRFTARPGQLPGTNSAPVNVTPKAAFTLRVTARVSPASAGNGYFTLIWFNAAGNEPSREIILFEPQTQTLDTATTARDGSFKITNAVDLNTYEVGAEYAGSDTLWPATVRSRAGMASGSPRSGRR